MRRARFVVVARHESVREARQEPSRCPESIGARGGSTAFAVAETDAVRSEPGPVVQESSGDVSPSGVGDDPVPGASEPSADEDSPEAGGSPADDPFRGEVGEGPRSTLFLLAALAVLAVFIAGSAVYAWWLRRTATRF